jgi:prepilin-type N-terminal cleavage/methylation domain-containing protein
MKKYNLGFTLVELMVVVSVIGILSSIVYANFGSARAAARDDIRKSSLEEVRLALELYKAQYGRYPLSCRGDNAWSGANHALYDCATVGKDSRVYIEGLVPEFIAELPWDPNTGTNRGYLYRTGNWWYSHISYWQSTQLRQKAGYIVRRPICALPGSNHSWTRLS